MQKAPQRKALRIWMTGSVAVVMASLVTLRAMPESERSRRLLRASPYGVAETLLRLEAAALRHGLTVLLREGGSEPVIVLASSAGGTPVSLDDLVPEVPMALQVRAGAEGRAEVLSVDSAPGVDGELRAVSPAAADELAALPRLLDSALA